MEEDEGSGKMYMEVTSRALNGRMASFSELFIDQTQCFMLPMDIYFSSRRPHILVFFELIYFLFYTFLNQFKYKTNIRD